MAKKDTSIRHSQLTVFPHCKTAVHAYYVALQLGYGNWEKRCKKPKHMRAPGARLTIRLMEVVIEPAEFFGVIYTIIQIRRCVPLQNESKGEYVEASKITACVRAAYHWSPTRLGVRAVDKGRGSGVHGCGVGGIFQSVGVGLASE